VKQVHDVAAVRAAEDALMALVSPGGLMQRAAHGLATTCAELLIAAVGVYGARVVVLVGAGNNGGDALFAAARLAQRGALVTAITVASSYHVEAAQALRAHSGRVVPATDPAAGSLVAEADLVVDGIVGIGGRGALRDPAARLAELATTSDAVVVAVDLPSGVDADTGAVDGAAVWADVTVTFGALKPGLLVTPGALHTGLVDLVDIGLGPHLGAPAALVMEPPDVAHIVPAPGPLDHKYTRGVAGVCAGSQRYVGAAVLCAAGALHSGAGLVRASTPAADAVVRALPSAVVSDAPPSQVGRSDAWAVGPGLGLDDEAAGRLSDVLALPVPVVVDADGLTLLASRLHDEPDLLRARDAATVLTPHLGEAARLCPDLDGHGPPLQLARTMAQRLGATVLLKGYTTVVASPEGAVWVNPTGSPWLATGGTGDVLTGMVTTLLARHPVTGATPDESTAAAAFLHGLAARLAADDAPVTALAVAEHVPAALRVVVAEGMGDCGA
jgi:hydroxyethylthiazole kinase-like uncharacterized protein yjeF